MVFAFVPCKSLRFLSTATVDGVPKAHSRFRAIIFLVSGKNYKKEIPKTPSPPNVRRLFFYFAFLGLKITLKVGTFLLCSH